MNDYDDGYDVAQICLKGHVVNSRTHQYPQDNAEFCTTCGSPTRTTCKFCHKDIRGPGFGFVPGLDFDSYSPPPFCHACGKPYPWKDGTEKGNIMSPKVFISHSSNDRELAAALVEVLDKAFQLPHGDIRCTSLPGYGLESGAPISTTLHQELGKSSVVLGVLTHRGRHSDWVLFELGAAWGIGKLVIPILCGLSHSDLPGPLAEQNAVNISDPSKVFELVETVKGELGLELQSAARVNEAITKLVQAASQSIKKENAPEDTSLSSPHPFVEESGVLWKRKSSGGYEEIAYCPKCKLAMSEFPPGSNQMLICSQCNFTASFRPNNLKDIVDRIPKSEHDDLEEIEISILKLVAEKDAWVEAEDVSMRLNTSETRIKYYLEEMKKKGFLMDSINAGRSEYRLAQKGRAYLVKEDLV